MRTLTDITSKTVNMSARTDRFGSQSQYPTKAPSQNENLSKAKTPRFMSPTLASTKQAASVASVSPQGSNRTSATAESFKLEKASTGKWMTSAAKRVGFVRASNGSARSKKEGPKPPSQPALTFPDKVSLDIF